jgi:hypothetical protein
VGHVAPRLRSSGQLLCDEGEWSAVFNGTSAPLTLLPPLHRSS